MKKMVKNFCFIVLVCLTFGCKTVSGMFLNKTNSREFIKKKREKTFDLLRNDSPQLTIVTTKMGHGSSSSSTSSTPSTTSTIVLSTPSSPITPSSPGTPVSGSDIGSSSSSITTTYLGKNKVNKKRKKDNTSDKKNKYKKRKQNSVVKEKDAKKQQTIDIPECSICLEKCFVEKKHVVLHPCLHHVHLECISLWKKACIKAEKPLTCPICRKASEIKSLTSFKFDIVDNNAFLNDVYIAIEQKKDFYLSTKRAGLVLEKNRSETQNIALQAIDEYFEFIPMSSVVPVVSPVQSIITPVITTTTTVASNTPLGGVNAENLKKLILGKVNAENVTSEIIKNYLEIFVAGEFNTEQKNSLLNALSKAAIKKNDLVSIVTIKEKYPQWFTQNMRNLILFSISEKQSGAFDEVSKSALISDLWKAPANNPSALEVALEKKCDAIIKNIVTRIKNSHIQDAHACVKTLVALIKKHVSDSSYSQEIIKSLVVLVLLKVKQNVTDNRFWVCLRDIHEELYNAKNFDLLLLVNDKKYVPAGNNAGNEYVACIKKDIVLAIEKKSYNHCNEFCKLLSNSELLTPIDDIDTRNILEVVLKSGALDCIKNLLARLVPFFKSSAKKQLQGGTVTYEFDFGFLQRLSSLAQEYAHTDTFEPIFNAFVDLFVYALAHTKTNEWPRVSSLFFETVEKVFVMALKGATPDITKKMLESIKTVLYSIKALQRQSMNIVPASECTAISIIGSYFSKNPKIFTYLKAIILLVVKQGLDDSLIDTCIAMFAIKPGLVACVINEYLDQGTITFLQDIKESEGYAPSSGLNDIINKNLEDVYTERTVLHLAVEENKKAVVAWLLKHGGCVEKLTKLSNVTPLAAAIKNKNEDIQALIVKAFSPESLEIFKERYVTTDDNTKKTSILCGSEYIEVPATCPLIFDNNELSLESEKTSEAGINFVDWGVWFIKGAVWNGPKTIASYVRALVPETKKSQVKQPGFDIKARDTWVQNELKKRKLGNNKRNTNKLNGEWHRANKLLKK
jgi:hypothetical protein